MDWSSREISDKDGAPLRLFGLGHSHITGLLHADAARRHHAPNLPGRTAFRFASMLEPQFQPTLSGEGTAATLHPALLGMMQDEIAAGAGPLVFAAISGNEHHFLGMVNHPRPFDFVLRERPHLPLWPGAEIVPQGLLAAALDRYMAGPKAQLAALRRACKLPILYICSPPPVPDQEFVARQQTVFSQPIAELGVAPATLRWKLWRLQSRLYAEVCSALGIGFLPPPRDTLDGEGFLARPAWHADCVHANHWYGEHVLQQIEGRAHAMRRAAAQPAVLESPVLDAATLGPAA